jgi:agmatine/peptidylarginine deiminase
MSNLEFYDIRTNSYWTRDFGPWWVQDGTGEYRIVDHQYNRPRLQDNQAPQRLAELWGVPYHNSGITHCGGNMMCDGKGVVMSTDLGASFPPSFH